MDLDRLDFDKGGGTVPLIAQHHRTGEVLMLGCADRDAMEHTLETGLLTFRSRSRGRRWTKGETTGNVLRVISLTADCDSDAVLALVDPRGPTCHTGQWSCFGAPPTLAALAMTLEHRRGADPGGSYTAHLLADRNQRLKKLGEEAVELAVACADGDTGRVGEEAADLLYHVLVACAAEGVMLDDVLRAFDFRAAARPSAHARDEQPEEGEQQE